MHKEAPWLCVACGYLMDGAHSPQNKKAVPKEGDVSLCMNCACLYTRHDGRWEPMTRDELAALPEALTNKLFDAARVILTTVGGKLTKRDGHA